MFKFCGPVKNIWFDQVQVTTKFCITLLSLLHLLSGSVEACWRKLGDEEPSLFIVFMLCSYLKLVCYFYFYL